MPYTAGEVWAYHTRPGGEDSRATILKVDTDPRGGTIVHVALDGLSIPSAHGRDGYVREAGHLPLSEEALDRSVVELVETRPAPSAPGDGYATWREAFDAGKAGVFTMTLREIVQVLNDSLSKNG